MPPVVTFSLMVILGLVIAGLLTVGRRSRSNRHGRSKRGHMEWQPVVMGKDTEKSPDPWTLQLTGSLIQPLHGQDNSARKESHSSPRFALSEVMDEDDLFAEDPAPGPEGDSDADADAKTEIYFEQKKYTPVARGKELDAHRASQGPKLQLKQKIRVDNPYSPPRRRDKVFGRSPKPRTTPYKLHSGERVLVQAPFAISFVCEGVAFLTTERLMAGYRRTVIDIFPPRIMRHTRRHKLRLDRLQKVKLIETHRPSFLLVGLATFWWYPWGFLVALASVSAYFFLTRKEILVVSHQDQTRTYPLDAKHRDRFLATLEETLRRSRQQLKKEIAKKSSPVNNKSYARRKGS